MRTHVTWGVALLVSPFMVPWAEVSSQRLDLRPGLHVAPPAPVALGQNVTLGVSPVISATTYRYVATLRVTGGGRAAASVGCATPQVIGTGDRVNWRAPSGQYRLTVHSLTRIKGRDSSSMSYEVTAPNGGWLTVSLTQIPNPSPPGQITMQLSTNDRGPGHGYQWAVRFQGVPGTLPLLDWAAASTGPTISVPLILTPATYNVTARVGVHAANPCQTLETSNGALNGQVVR